MVPGCLPRFSEVPPLNLQPPALLRPQLVLLHPGHHLGGGAGGKLAHSVGLEELRRVASHH